MFSILFYDYQSLTLSLVLDIQSTLLLEVLHFPGSELCPNVVHLQIHDELLVYLEEFSQGAKRRLRDRIEADVYELQLSKNFDLIEEFDGALVLDAALLQPDLL